MTMSDPLTLDIPFEELPLLRSERGYSAGLIDGYARIAAFADGTWKIKKILVQVEKVFDPVTKERVNEAKHVEPEDLIRFVIKRRLREDPWKSRIQEQVDRELHAAETQEREYEAEVA